MAMSTARASAVSIAWLAPPPPANRSTTISSVRSRDFRSCNGKRKPPEPSAMCCLPGDNRLGAQQSHEPRSGAVFSITQPHQAPICTGAHGLPRAHLVPVAMVAGLHRFFGEVAERHLQIEALREKQRPQRSLATIAPRWHVRVTVNLAVGVARWEAT